MPRPTMWTPQLQATLQLACRAPSFHNSQPWLWTVGAGTVELHLDPERLVASDSSGRQALLSCGAILDHFRVASAATGWTANVDRYPNPNAHKHLATIDFSPMDFVTDGHRHRADAIRRRRTDRLPFAAPADWDTFEPLLHRIAGDVVLLDVLDAGARPALHKAAALTESARLDDSTYHADMYWWTTSSDSGTGIPHSSLTSQSEGDRVGIGRRFPITHHQDQRPEVPVDEARIVVLSTYDDTRLDVLRCGETLSAVLLAATMADLASCTLTHLTEVPAGRDILRELTGRELPQVLIRMGCTPADEEIPPPTPRLPLADVVTIRR